MTLHTDPVARALILQWLADPSQDGTRLVLADRAAELDLTSPWGVEDQIASRLRLPGRLLVGCYLDRRLWLLWQPVPQGITGPGYLASPLLPDPPGFTGQASWVPGEGWKFEAPVSPGAAGA